jgi:hypothetical protein
MEMSKVFFHHLPRQNMRVIRLTYIKVDSNPFLTFRSSFDRPKGKLGGELQVSKNISVVLHLAASVKLPLAI